MDKMRAFMECQQCEFAAGYIKNPSNLALGEFTAIRMYTLAATEYGSHTEFFETLNKELRRLANCSELEKAEIITAWHCYMSWLLAALAKVPCFTGDVFRAVHANYAEWSVKYIPGRKVWPTKNPSTQAKKNKTFVCFMVFQGGVVWVFICQGRVVEHRVDFEGCNRGLDDRSQEHGSTCEGPRWRLGSDEGGRGKQCAVFQGDCAERTASQGLQHI